MLCPVGKTAPGGAAERVPSIIDIGLPHTDRISLVGLCFRFVDRWLVPGTEERGIAGSGSHPPHLHSAT